MTDDSYMENQDQDVERCKLTKCGLTDREREVLDHLIKFWDSYLDLPDTIETQEVYQAVHFIQGIMAKRVARRVDPDYWAKKTLI